LAVIVEVPLPPGLLMVMLPLLVRVNPAVIVTPTLTDCEMVPDTALIATV
jgi:hypothetical protein